LAGAKGEGATGTRKRVVSGMRPTGRLHIGHYFGALQNWVKMQSEYECFYFVADWHALTTHYEDTSSIGSNCLQVVIDWLSVGINPAKSTIFLQSDVLTHAELDVILGMITPLGWLERVPTYKEQIENLKGKDLGTYGFLGYPVLQAADIVIYGADLVPVGEDQVAHVELTREIVRRFNSHFGFKVNEDLFRSLSFKKMCKRLSADAAVDHTTFNVELRKHVLEMGAVNFLDEVKEDASYFELKEVLHEPQAMLTQTPRLPGLDGRRMAKSYGNAIWLSDPADEIRVKVKNMMTDPARKRRTDPGNPDICPVFDWHKLFSPPETQKWSAEGCRSAGIGCIECKSAMADNLIKWIAPVQEERRKWEAEPQKVWGILKEGSERAREESGKTMERVREAIFGWNEAKRPSGDGGGTAGSGKDVALGGGSAARIDI
jgi:tryptophanyl-tRNA synthetase